MLSKMQNIKLIELAIQAAMLAGIEIMKVYQTDFEVYTKSDQSPVTQADLAASDIICKILAQTNIPIICEENPIEKWEIRKDWKQLWMIDPLDGTKDFIMRNGEFTVNIALIENNTPVGGVIYVPAIDSLYFGLEHIGAFFISKVSTTVDNFSWKNLLVFAAQLPLLQSSTEYVIMASRSFLDKETENFIAKIISDTPNARMEQLGSSLKFLRVATGKAHLYPRLSQIHEWDIAAGDAIARAAGCSVIDYNTNKDIVYNSEFLQSPNFIVSKT